MRGNLNTEDRSAAIRELLEAHGRVEIADLAQRLAVSQMTIRRDLELVEAQGLARRVRGGAIAHGPESFARRWERQAKAKAAIAVKLAKVISTSGAIGLDASSTMMRFVSAMPEARDLTVITNGQETFAALHGRPGITALLTGGQLDERTGSLVGPLACRAASDLLLDRLFVSAAAIDPQLGTSEACLEEADVKRSLGSVAGEIVVAIDSTKLDVRSVARAFEPDRISMLITELDPSSPELDAYRDSMDIL